MNKIIQRLFILSLLGATVACSTGKTEIKGIVEGGSEQTLVLERLDVNRTAHVDSVKIRSDGSFSFTAKPEEPELYIVKNESGDILNLLLSPGEKVTISTTADSFGKGYKVNGSVESDHIRQLVEHLNRTRSDIDSLVAVADSITDLESPQLDLIRNAYSQTIIKQKRYTIRYIVEHMTSLSSVYALYQKYDEDNLILGSEPDLQYFKTVADSLEIAFPNSSLTKSLRADITNREKELEQAFQVNSLLEMAGEVSGMLDLAISDRDGKEVSLSSLTGKVIMLAFWASGNESSVQSMIRLQPTYNRYHDLGFEVYAISLDNNKINWMNAIDYNEFDWINVSELSYPESRANMVYNVSALPTNFLINRDGDIVAKNLYGRTLETWLDNLI